MNTPEPEQLALDLVTDDLTFDEWIRGLPPIRPKPDKDEQAGE